MRAIWISNFNIKNRSNIFFIYMYIYIYIEKQRKALKKGWWNVWKSFWRKKQKAQYPRKQYRNLFEEEKD